MRLSPAISGVPYHKWFQKAYSLQIIENNTLKYIYVQEHAYNVYKNVIKVILVVLNENLTGILLQI